MIPPTCFGPETVTEAAHGNTATAPARHGRVTLFRLYQLAVVSVQVPEAPPPQTRAPSGSCPPSMTAATSAGVAAYCAVTVRSPVTDEKSASQPENGVPP